MYEFLMASEEDDCVPALIESAVLHLAFYYCLPAAYTSLSQLEGACYAKSQNVLGADIFFLKSVIESSWFFFCE